MDEIEEYGNEEELADQDAAPDLRKLRDDEALEEGAVQEAKVDGDAEQEPRRGIIKLGEEAKYSQGKTDAEKAAA